MILSYIYGQPNIHQKNFKAKPLDILKRLTICQGLVPGFCFQFRAFFQSPYLTSIWGIPPKIQTTQMGEKIVSKIGGHGG